MWCSLLVWAQKTVTGTVLDESNLEVIGANVKEKGTANGAITDMNGVFHLKDVYKRQMYNRWQEPPSLSWKCKG